SGAAIAVDGRAEQAELAQLVHDLAVELLMPVGEKHARHQLVLGVAASRVAHQPLFLGELFFQEQRILPDELGLGTVAGGTHLTLPVNSISYFDRARISTKRRVPERGRPVSCLT